MAPLLDVRNLKKHFVVRTGFITRTRKIVRAVDGVSFTVNEGETLGLVGESGCGKSTLVRTLVFLDPPTDGEIWFAGKQMTEREALRLRRQAQIILQDPYTSLPPRMRIRDIVADPLRIHNLVLAKVEK